MKFASLSTTLLSFCLLWGSQHVIAADGDEPGEQAKALREKAARIGRTIKEQNREQAELLAAAEKLERNAREKGDKSPPADPAVHVRKMHERLQELVAREQKLRESKGSESELAEVRQQIANIKLKLDHIHGGGMGPGPFRPEFREQAMKIDLVTNRINHMRAAAEHLKQAEIHDVARHLNEKANELENEVRKGREQLGAAMREAHRHHPDEMASAVRELRGEVERLRAEVKELNQKLEKR